MRKTLLQRLKVGAAMSLLLSSTCADSRSNQPSSHSHDGEYDGVSVVGLSLLAAGCSITGTTMNVVVKDGESAYVTMRAGDSTVTVNGNVFGWATNAGAGGTMFTGSTAGRSGAGGSSDSGRPCELPVNGSINIVADTGGTHTIGRSVVLDYVNGLFMTATSATTPNIKVDFSLTGDNGALNSIKVRGSKNADSFAVGMTATAGISALNINSAYVASTGGAGSGGSGGSSGSAGSAGRSGSSGSAGAAGRAGSGGAPAVATGLDAFPDVTFKNAPLVVISAGDNDDRLDASGAPAAGVGTVYTAPVNLFGNDGNDTLIGGSAGDVLAGGLGADVLNGCAGDDTYDMGAVPSGADTIAEACTATEGNDTLDYSKRTGNLTVTLNTTGTSGESSGDGAHISDKVVNILLGAGDDKLTIPGTGTIHKVKGGAGDDTFIGNAGGDTFDGEGGDDSCVGDGSIMDYSARTVGITVTQCTGSGCAPPCGSTSPCPVLADQNDGDQRATASSHTGTGATSAAAGGLSIATLTGTGFTAASVGNTVTLSTCGADNGDVKIVSWVNATTVRVDTTPISGWLAVATCSFLETKPDGTTNPGSGTPATGAATTVAAPSESVTGLSHTTYMLGHQLTLTHSPASTGGGVAHTNDDGTYYVVKVLSTTSVAIDAGANVTYAGSVTALTWSEVGNEHDNVQCANVLGGTGADSITGDSRDNIIHGGAGIDTLSGGSGNDTLFGEDNNDTLYGGANSDTLIGGDGMDTLIGGDGNDVLEGDQLADVFTCDGKNFSTDPAAGTVPGDSDFRIDYVSLTDTLSPAAPNSDCEF